LFLSSQFILVPLLQHIESSFDDSSDEEQELLALLLFLESLVGAEDALGARAWFELKMFGR
jgi:hypothetical protein